MNVRSTGRRVLRRPIMLVLALLGLGLIAARPFQGGPEPTELPEVLTWVAFSGGGVWVVSQFVSLFLENVSWWHTLSPGLKITGTLGASVALGLGASYLVDQPDVIAQIQPYYKIVVLAVTSWLASQMAYMKTKSLRANGTPYGAQGRESS